MSWSPGRCLVAAFVLGAPALPQSSSPVFRGTHLPVPPQQHAPWSLPKVWVPGLVTTTKQLFEQGLADPRGLEYREIGVAIGSCWTGAAGVAKTHGWVFPVGEGKQRHAVCWNGLVYPVVDVGPRADVEKDVEGLFTDDARERNEARGRGGYLRGWAVSEDTSVSHETLLPIKACLLLRLGHAKLAHRVFSASRVPYRVLARDWVWALYDRAVCAHMRGDDRLALLSAERLLSIRKGELGLYVDFLDSLDDLVADQRRRAERVAPPVAGKLPANQAERIAVLVDALEDVAERQWGQPGGVDLSRDPIVRLLVAEGEPAVEPLLECLAHDSRLTRSVQFSRDFSRDRQILKVYEAANMALSCILGTWFFEYESYYDTMTARGEKKRAEVAAAIRRFWLANRDCRPHERWVATLANDAAGHDQWIQAARHLAKLSNARDEQGKKLHRALLRLKHPTVSELLQKRVEDLAAPMSSGKERFEQLHMACMMCIFYLDWAHLRAVPTARALFRELAKETAESKPQGSRHFAPYTWPFDRLCGLMAWLTIACREADDPDALSEYATWLLGLRPVSSINANPLVPLTRYPKDPLMRRLVKWVFGDDSPWADSDGPWQRGLGSELRADFLAVPEYRDVVVARLADDSAGGIVTLQEPDGLYINYAGGRISCTSAPWRCDPLAGKLGPQVTFRAKDSMAKELSELDGFPRFELYWPEKDRDRALARTLAHLRRYGDRYRVGPNLSGFPEAQEVAARFPELDGPATRADVEAGLAIFSLPGERRSVDLGKLPRTAQWITLKECPFRRRSFDESTGKMTEEVAWDQGGQVWQAEEQHIDGAWKRFYGFVGAGHIARVPADEIEFPGGELWSPVAGSLDCRLKMPGSVLYDSDSTPEPVTANQPLVFALELHNRAGHTQEVARDWIWRDGQKLVIRDGLEFRLRWHPPAPRTWWFVKVPAQKSTEWKDVAPKPVTRGDRSGRRSVEAAHEFQAFETDVRLWFEVEKPGFYELRVRVLGGTPNAVVFAIGNR